MEKDNEIWKEHTFTLEKSQGFDFGFIINNDNRRKVGANIVISGVQKNGTAFGKLENNDILLLVNSKPFTSSHLAALEIANSGNSVELTIKRKITVLHDSNSITGVLNRSCDLDEDLSRNQNQSYSRAPPNRSYHSLTTNFDPINSNLEPLFSDVDLVGSPDPPMDIVSPFKVADTSVMSNEQLRKEHGALLKKLYHSEEKNKFRASTIQTLSQENKDLSLKIEDHKKQIISKNIQLHDSKNKLSQLDLKLKEKEECLTNHVKEIEKLKNLISQLENCGESSNTRQKNYFMPHDVQINQDKDGFLGKGGFGSVHLGLIKHIGVVAIKCISLIGCRSGIEDKKERILHEIEMYTQARHPHIVSYIGYTDWGRYPRNMGIIMEYMHYGSLKGLVTPEKNPLDIPLVVRLRFVYEIACGISFLHNLDKDKRMTHGDLKTENILLSNDLHCKIADFGGADLATATDSTTSIIFSAKQQREHTWLYSAPERLQNHKSKVTKAMDVYSFSMMVFTILCRRSPCIGAEYTRDEHKSLVAQGKRPVLEPQFSEFDGNILSLLQNQIIQCWLPDPESRPKMIEVRDTVEALLAQQDDSEIKTHVVNIIKMMKEKPVYNTSIPFEPIVNYK